MSEGFTSLVITVTDATCNGDGNGMIGNNFPEYAEKWLLWQHLHDANMVWGGPYTGFFANYWLEDSIKNVPIAHSGIGAFTVHDMTPSLANFSPESSQNLIKNSFSGKVIMLGAILQHNVAYGPIFTTTETLGIDIKLDDGKPDSGNVLMYRNDVSFGYAPTDGTLLQNCVTSNVIGSSEYNIATNGFACNLIVKAKF